MSKLVI